MADAALGKLVVEFSANVARFQQDMQSAVGIAETLRAAVFSGAAHLQALNMARKEIQQPA